jgi:uncharacterized protein YjiS (DUF1127 family)
MSCGGTCSSSQPQMLRPELAAVPWHLPSPMGWFWGWLVWLVYLQARWRIREELQMLNDAQLRDVGLTRAQVDSELRRPFWKDAT